MLHFAVFHGNPCPKPMLPILRKLTHDTGAIPNSVYRGDEVAGILHRHGKHTQRELYEMGFPANPPGVGSHVLCGDGVVGAYGVRLPWWMCGTDWEDSDTEKVIEDAAKHGWKMYRPYSSGSEYHHLNFARKPSNWRALYWHVFGKAHHKVRDHRVAKHVKHPSPQPTELSARGAEFIAGFEGFRPHAYWDSFGRVWTIGFGHTRNVGPGQIVTRATGLHLLRQDAKDAAQAVSDLVDVPLTQNQFDALVSFAFNLGSGALAESTLLRKLNAGKYKAAAKEFKRWNHAGGVVLAGLTRRRNAEARLFNRP